MEGKITNDATHPTTGIPPHAPAIAVAISWIINKVKTFPLICCLANDLLFS